MSRAGDVLNAYRSAGLAAREQLGGLLAPAGVAVTEVVPDGEGWLVRLVPRGDLPSYPERAGMPAPARRDAEGRDLDARITPLVRGDGESLFALGCRGLGRMGVAGEGGPGGLQVAPLADEERVRLLAGTLVGDTVLALRHLGGEAEAAGAAAEFARQFNLFNAESRRMGFTGDSAPFAAALDRWTQDRSGEGFHWLRNAMEAEHA